MLIARDTMVFLLQNLGFLIMSKVSIQLCQRIEYWGVIRESKEHQMHQWKVGQPFAMGTEQGDLGQNWEQENQM